MTGDNINNGSVIPPLLVGVAVTLLTLVMKHVKENIISKNSNNAGDEDWLEQHAAFAAPKSLNPLDAIQAELNRIQQYDGAGTRIFNSFVRAESTLKQLADPKLWDACNENRSKWWDGSGDPQNIWQDLAQQIWSPLVESRDAVGYEYWCNVLDPTTGLDWHVDKDEELYMTRGELAHPIMGAVYYGFPHTVVGGYLESIDAEASVLEFDGGRESIRPEYNRLVILNVSKWHRVSEIRAGERYTFAVNIWKKKPIGL